MKEKLQKKPKAKWKKPPQKKSTIMMYFIIRVLIVFEIVLCLFRGDFHSVFICALSLLLMLLPSICEHKLKIDLPDTLEVIIILFIFSAEILGEINSFYIRVPHWDTVLHTLNGFLCAAVGFAMIDILNRNERFSFKLSPQYLAIAAFCFSMTVGVMWEFFEYGCDQLLNLDMQKDYIVNSINSVELDGTNTNTVIHIEDIQDVIIVHSDGTQESLALGGYLDVGITDTMKDLFVNFIGAVIFSGIGFFYVKHRGKNKFAEHFIPQIWEENNIKENSKYADDKVENTDILDSAKEIWIE